MHKNMLFSTEDYLNMIMKYKNYKKIEEHLW